MIDPYLPHEPEVEARFLSAAIVALPQQRAQILAGATRSYFFDDWHRWLFDELQSGYGLDGAELLDYLYRRRREPIDQLEAKLGKSGKDMPEIKYQRGECRQLGHVIAKLLIDFDDSSVAGLVADWPLYLAELKAMSDRRLKLLRLMAELEAACG